MVKIRENLAFIISDEIQAIKYVPGSLIATKGQPTEEPVIVDLTEGIVTLQIMSGRKKSRPVANEFKKSSSSFRLTTQGGSDGAPEELNFMFSLKAILKDGREVLLHLGQGSRMGVRNNWWIGSSDDLSPLNVSPSSLNKEGFDVKEILEGVVPPKWEGLLAIVNEALLKDLIQEVNVFKID